MSENSGKQRNRWKTQERAGKRRKASRETRRQRPERGGGSGPPFGKGTAAQRPEEIAGANIEHRIPPCQDPGTFFSVFYEKNSDFWYTFAKTNQQVDHLWTMATVTRIAAVSYLDTIPFLYGIAHAADLRAELLLSDLSSTIRDFRDRRADIALVPVHVVPSLGDARIITEYCIAALSPVMIEALAACEPDAEICRCFVGGDAPLAPLLASGEPFAYAVWVAHADTDTETVEALQHALTAGLEHTYEAVVEYGYADKPYDAYGYLTRIDYVFDNQKHQALEKFWNAGLKTAPRANPG